jgi:hypothetical protein
MQLYGEEVTTVTFDHGWVRILGEGKQRCS